MESVNAKILSIITMSNAYHVRLSWIVYHVQEQIIAQNVRIRAISTKIHNKEYVCVNNHSG